MKIKKLEIHNLASIKDATIDFEKGSLADAELFLITGTTGSGKTTLLDAISLALYNTTPRIAKGQSGKAEANADNLTGRDPRNIMRQNTGYAYSKLWFEGNDGTNYLAEWSVSRGKYCKVNVGLSNAIWSITNLDTGACISEQKEGRKDEGGYKDVEAVITAAIGLDFNQFCRTTMLAQGEFTEFLKSDESAKAEILEKISGTEIYRKIGKEIHSQYGKIKTALEQAQNDHENIAILDTDERMALESELAQTLASILTLDAEEKALAVAFRYTGKSNTYRLDNVEFGAAEAPVEVLTVTTGEATNVTTTTATMAGSYAGVTEAPAEVGVEYRMSGAADYTKVAAAAVAESFSVEVADLIEESTYEYRAYAVAGEVTTYGEVKTFTTAAPATPSTPSVTIPELIASMTSNAAVYDADSDYVFEGVVLTDVDGGNYTYNNLIVMTEGATTPNNAVVIYNNPLNQTPSFNAGDKVRVTLKAGVAKTQVRYGVPQLTGITDSEIEKIGEGVAVTPIKISYDKLVEYVNMPVEIDNVQSVATSGVWSSSSANTSHKFTVNGDESQQFVVYVKKAAGVFVDVALATGNGTIKGIASVYSNAGQIVPRNLDDVAGLTGARVEQSKITPAATSMSFVAEGESKTNELTVAGQGELSLFAKSSDEHFTAAIEGTTLTVTAAANTTTEAKSATVTVYMAESADAEAVASVEIACSQAAPSSGEGEGEGEGETTEQVVYTTGFEVNNRDTSTNNSYTVDAKTYTADGKVWTFVYADLVTTGKPLVGSFNAMARIAKNTTNTPTITTAAISETNKVTKVVFKSTAPATISMKVQYSTDNGVTWVDSDFNQALTTTTTEYTANINASGSVMIRFAPYVTNGTATSSNRDIKVDDVTVYGMK